MSQHRSNWLSRVRARQGAMFLALTLTWLASACVVTSPPPSEPYPPPPPSNEGPGEPEPQPPYSSPDEPGQEPGYEPANCSQPRPSVACCKALTPECTGCMDRARAMQEQWDRECTSSGPAPSVNCNEAPGRMCCEAQTAECQSCKQKAAAERAEWSRQCQGAEAPATPPSQPAVDCSQPPGRMCCQAETEACRSCKRAAAAERAAWERECS
jgi:hypothetical protein